MQKIGTQAQVEQASIYENVQQWGTGEKFDIF